jgi:hypothetical protein
MMFPCGFPKIVGTLCQIWQQKPEADAQFGHSVANLSICTRLLHRAASALASVFQLTNNVCGKPRRAAFPGCSNPDNRLGVDRIGTTLPDPYGRGACGVCPRLSSPKVAGAALSVC